jgi:hypothetical protein
MPKAPPPLNTEGLPPCGRINFAIPTLHWTVPRLTGNENIFVKNVGSAGPPNFATKMSQNQWAAGPREGVTIPKKLIGLNRLSK